MLPCCRSCLLLLRRGAFEIGFQLPLARQVLLGPGDVAVADARGFLQRPRRVGQVRTRDRAKIGAAGGDDRVDMIGLEDRADGNGGNARLVADAIGERGLVHAAIHRRLVRADLSRRAIDHVGAGGLEGAGDLDGVVGRDAAFDPVVRRDAHRHRLVLRPYRAHRFEHLQRIAQPRRQRAAVFVVARIGQRRDKARQQVAVGAVQLEPVKTRFGRAAGTGHEIVAHAVHVGARHLARGLRLARQVRQRRGRHHRPVALRQRMVHRLPAELRRPLAARVADLHGDARIAAGMHEIDDALPCVALLIVPQARAARRDARIGRHAGHFRHHHAGATQRARTEVNQVEVARHAIGAGVHGHRRHHHAVLQRDAAQPERREHRRQRLGLAQLQALLRHAGPLRQPVLELRHIIGVAYAQVLVRDALRTRQQRIGELLRRQAAGVALDVLEPLGRVARGILDLQHFHAARSFIACQRIGQAVVAAAADLFGQVDRIFQCQFGTGADREVCRVRGIAHQHHRHATAVRQRIPVHPLAADHAREADPDRRAAQVRRIGDQLVAVEVARKQLLAIRHALFLAHLVDAGGLPDRFRRLDDKGRGVVVEAVGMRLEPAVLGLLEGESEGVEQLVRAQPDKAALARVDVGPEGLGVAGADAAVQAIRGDHQVGLVLHRQRLVVGDIVLEYQPDAERFAARLQDIEQALAADADKAVATGADGAAADMDVDIVPVIEGGVDLGGAVRIGLLEVVHGGVGEHHAPAEGVIGPVALDHDDLVGRILQLHQQAEVQPGRSAANTKHSHLLPPAGAAPGNAARRHHDLDQT
ncbi:conserved hypothetical protein [Cupriavidus oxalaticus]|uniref:Uncharacterized protein n=1 Tax=Cupriavidus oxalaticus TaxID=96344 RepID=A0A375G4S5_9BURK|nr:conserved hypothetical protein [Cupriavidus oxalaticus]